MSKSKKNNPSEQPEAPSPEFVKYCRGKVEIALGSAIRSLFDDSNDGGEFYAHMCMQMDRIYDDPRIPTAAVNITDKINLYINSIFFVHTLGEDLGLELNREIDERTLSEANRRTLSLRRAAVVKHEILHCIFHHMLRGRDFGNPMLVNIAADLVVNSNIEATLLPMGMFPENFNLPKDETLEFYYKNFPIEDNPLCSDPDGHDREYSQQQNNNSQQKQQNPDGTPEEKEESAGHDHAVDENGQCKVCQGLRPFDSHDVWTEDEGSHISEAMKESLVKDAVNRSAESTRDAGSLPKGVRQAIELARARPLIPWQNILRQFVAKLSSSDLLYTKRKISKRFGTRPGVKLKQKLKLAVLPDVSGSISEREYTTFLNEIFAIAKHIGEVTVVEWDVKVQGQYKIAGYKPNVTRLGSGGTDPREAIQWVNDRKNKIDGAIFMTDGFLCTEDLKEKIRIPNLWVVTSDGNTEALKKYRKIKLPKVQGN